jgi:iron complex transport system substrate-binding protein
LDGSNKSLKTIEKTGIPVLINADWRETHPLGKAEWIKFFGALYNKSKEADAIFKTIESGYLETKKLAQNVTQKPTVLSGAMYKDVWYLPHGESWPAQLIKDAGGHYLWADTKGTGSIALNIESVLEKGQDAQFWIAPGQFGSYNKLKEANPVYASFDAFKNKKVYTFTSKKGATGGLLYYELAPNRPDLVLKDIVYYLHPELVPEYTPYFYTPFED